VVEVERAFRPLRVRGVTSTKTTKILDNGAETRPEDYGNDQSRKSRRGLWTKTEDTPWGRFVATNDDYCTLIGKSGHSGYPRAVAAVCHSCRNQLTPP